jgi:hypothetical protein
LKQMSPRCLRDVTRLGTPDLWKRLQAAKKMSSSNGSKRKLSVEHRVNELLELFYPVHYKMGFEFEDAMRMGGSPGIKSRFSG